jgi:hypothetical protein
MRFFPPFQLKILCENIQYLKNSYQHSFLDKNTLFGICWLSSVEMTTPHRMCLCSLYHRILFLQLSTVHIFITNHAQCFTYYYLNLILCLCFFLNLPIFMSNDFFLLKGFTKKLLFPCQYSAMNCFLQFY